VCWVPENRYAVFAAVALDHGHRGCGRADGESWYKGEDCAVKFIEVFAVGVYEVRFIFWLIILGFE